MVKYFVEKDGINDPIQYKHASDAGMDICSNEDATIHFGEIKVVHTGLHVQLPEGYEIQVRPRSGLANKGITVVNAPGTIDEGYTGEICIILSSMSILHDREYQDEMGSIFHSIYDKDSNENEDEDYGLELYKDNGFKINKGDRIAQLVISKVVKDEWIKVKSEDELKSSDGRGSNGFGSTGVK